MFYNALTNCEINEKNSEHVFNIWEAFTMSTMRGYHDLYPKVDVLLLACFFETFRKESIHSFALDLAQFLSSIAYIWEMMLRIY